MTVAIKICGIREPGIIDEAVRLGCDYMGLIFFPKSPRNVNISEAAALAAHARGQIATVAVTVNADDALLSAIASLVQPDYLQLHGGESVERVMEIKEAFGIQVIRAIKARTQDDITRAETDNHANMLLFDAAPPPSGLPGGNAVSFDWQLLSGRDIQLPWMLSGGLNAENIASALHTTGAPVVDISSGVESSPGVKDKELMKLFVNAVRNYEAKK